MNVEIVMYILMTALGSAYLFALVKRKQTKYIGFNAKFLKLLTLQTFKYVWWLYITATRIWQHYLKGTYS